MKGGSERSRYQDFDSGAFDGVSKSFKSFHTQLRSTINPKLSRLCFARLGE
jgi:hypothetical protein